MSDVIVYLGLSPETLLVLVVGLTLGILFVWFIYRRHSAELRLSLGKVKEEANHRLVAQQRSLEDDFRRQLHEQEIGLARLQTEVQQKDAHIERLSEENRRLKRVGEDVVELKARLEAKEEQLASNLSLIEEAKKQLTKEFELSANKLFESKQQQFSETSKLGMEALLNPFKSQLKDFNQRVEDIYHKENSQRNQLAGQLAELQKQTLKISGDANNLANALKGDNKVQGDWGEIVLERLLEQSGLEKGREYETQVSLKSEEGRGFRPDVIVRLPDQKDIVIDAKVSLLEYEKFVSSESAEEREKALRSHIDSLRAHVKGLSVKQYEKLEGIRTLDFVFIFVPIEAAYLTALQHSPGLFRDAYEKQILLVSPSSLMVALRTVETLWRYEKQNLNAEKIAASAGKLYDQLALVLQSLEDMGGYIGKAVDSYDAVKKRLMHGRGNLVKRVTDLKALGAKTSKALPRSVVAELELQDEIVEPPVIDPERDDETLNREELK